MKEAKDELNYLMMTSVCPFMRAASPETLSHSAL